MEGHCIDKYSTDQCKYMEARKASDKDTSIEGHEAKGRGAAKHSRSKAASGLAGQEGSRVHPVRGRGSHDSTIVE